MSGHRNAIKLADSPVTPGLADESRSGSGLKFRETRIPIPKHIKCTLKWRDFYGAVITAEVRDISRFGCRITIPTESAHKLYVKIAKAVIEIDGVTAYTGVITFVNEKKESDGSLSAGLTLEDRGCDLDAIAAASGVRSVGIETDLRRVVSISEVVQSEFKILVADMNALLQEAKQKIDLEEKKLSEISQSDNHRFRLEERLISVAMSIYGPKLQSILAKFEEIVREMSSDEQIPYKQYFRLNFQGIIKGTPFVERGLKKPLGYSGDYGMMVMLYEYSDQGDTLFNRFFHRFVCSEPAAVANKNRVGFLSDILMNAYEKAVKDGAKSFSIASLACGPAREIYEFLKYSPLDPKVPVKIVLIDTEEHALDYAQSRLRELSLPPRSTELIFLKEDVVAGTLQAKEFLQRIQGSDFIISAGLFDYLTDRISSRMIGVLSQYLKKGGELLIGNISKRSPDVFAMDYFMDWRLILRDEPDLLKLVTEEAIQKGATPDVLAESLGLNLFLRVKNKG
jgi:extracellular factor (EF) 3-hydroxypalmitic acid methyl ester biosynthesis protein